MSPLPAQLAPGAYVTPARPEGDGPLPLSTDITGFAGITERGPLGEPTGIDSWRDFEVRFGGLAGPGHLPAAVRGYFENGGRRCFVVRVASRDEAGGAAAARLTTGGWELVASSSGSWANALRVRLVRRHPIQLELGAADPGGDFSTAESVGGLARGMLAVLTQEGSATSAARVVSDVDPIRGRVIWVHEDGERRLPSDAPLPAFDPERPVLARIVEYALVVTAGGVPLALHEGLAPSPAHPRYAPTVLAATGAQVRIEEHRSPAHDPAQIPTAIEGALTGGRDGLALLEPADFAAAHAALAEVDEVALMASPDLHARPRPPVLYRPRPPEPAHCCPPHPEPSAERVEPVAPEEPPELARAEILRLQADLVQRCEERRDRMALLEVPRGAGLADAIAWRESLDSSFCAIYHPWLRTLGQAMPPTGHVAGLYARSELDSGIHRAPANSPQLEWLDDVVTTLDDDAHGLLNERGVNAIRALPSRGLRVLGARTASRERPFHSVPVRRLVIHVRRACERALQWCVFEPNDAMTRAKVSLTLTSYLASLWQRGSLAGETAQAAFIVRTDESVNTAADREDGRLIAEIGIAPLLPYEFVMVHVWRVGDSLETGEATAAERVAA